MSQTLLFRCLIPRLTSNSVNAVVVPVVQEIARSIRPGLVDENMATGLQPDLLLDAG